jgi:hypothetical protein
MRAIRAKEKRREKCFIKFDFIFNKNLMCVARYKKNRIKQKIITTISAHQMIDM